MRHTLRDLEGRAFQDTFFYRCPKTARYAKLGWRFAAKWHKTKAGQKTAAVDEAVASDDREATRVDG